MKGDSEDKSSQRGMKLEKKIPNEATTESIEKTKANPAENESKSENVIKYKPKEHGPSIVFMEQQNINLIRVGKLLRSLSITVYIGIDKISKIRVRDYKSVN